MFGLKAELEKITELLTFIGSRLDSLEKREGARLDKITFETLTVPKMKKAIEDLNALSGDVTYSFHQDWSGNCWAESSKPENDELRRLELYAVERKIDEIKIKKFDECKEKGACK